MSRREMDSLKASWRTRAERGEKVRSSPRPATPLPEEAQTLLDQLPANETADLLREALERPEVRKAFMDRYVRVPPGVNLGERGEMALYISRYYNAPSACLMAITRQHPETGEWQVMVGSRENGQKTIPGGHFSPFTAEECWDYFFRQGFSPEALHHYFRMQPPAADHEGDAKSKDINLMAAVQKETLQEANLFLIPQELSKTDQENLAAQVEASFPQASVSRDYEVVSGNTLCTTVGEVGKNWHSLIIGFGIRLHDQQALDAPVAGDDLAKVEWVSLSDLSPLSSKEAQKAGTYDAGKTYLGDMPYGEKPIVLNALRAMEKETPEIITTSGGQRLDMDYTIAEIEYEARKIAHDFGLETRDLLGDKPEQPVGPENAAYHARCRQFIAAHHEMLQAPFARQGVEHVSDLYRLEKGMLEHYAAQSGVKLDLSATDAASFERNHVQRMLRQFTPRSHAQGQGNSLAA